LRKASELVLSDIGATIQTLRLIGRDYDLATELPNRMGDCIASLDLGTWFGAMSARRVAFEGRHSAATAFWKHGRLIAQYAQLVAESLDRISPEDAYLVGLLHEVGAIPKVLGWPDGVSGACDPVALSALEGSLPLFVLFAAASLKTQIHVNWTAPAFLSLTLGGAAIMLDGLGGQGHVRAIWWRVGVWATVAMCALVIVFGHTSLAFGFPDFFAYTRSGGWSAVAQEVDAARARVRSETNLEPFVLGMEKYNIAAEMGFYLHTPDECVNLYATGAQGLGYRYWTDLRKFEGRPAVAVLPRPSDDLMALLRQHFERVGEAWHVRVPAHGRQSREVYLVICTGYHAAQRKPRGSA